MPRILVCVLVLALPIPSFAQPPEARVLATHVRGVGGPVLGVAQAGAGAAFITGGRGGLLFDRRWLVGAGFVGTPLLGGRPAAIESTGEHLGYWQAGLLVEHVFRDDWLVHPRVGVQVGGAYLSIESENRESRRSSFAFAVEPNVSLELNVTRFLRMSVTAGYRLLAPVPRGLRITETSGVTGVVTLDFGWFGR